VDGFLPEKKAISKMRTPGEAREAPVQAYRKRFSSIAANANCGAIARLRVIAVPLRMNALFQSA
jgi:hypothetical protein